MLKRTFTKLLITSAVLMVSNCFAIEPPNLSQVKEQVVAYHDSGEYAKDTNQVISKAMKYLKKRVKNNKDHKKLAIILDIDETSLSNYNDMKRLDFGGTIEEMRADEDKGIDEAIVPTLILYKYAKANDVAVFFLTGRYEEERGPTASNLKAVGYKNWDGLILRDGKYRKLSAVKYKTAMRKALTNQGYDIIMTVGDQQSDLTGGFADKTFKLPNPYYYIP